MAFVPVFNPFKERPTSQSLRSPSASFLTGLRDHFTLPTWLMIGAFIQGLICLLPYPNIALIAPVILYLGFHSIQTILQCYGLLPNPRMQGIIPGRFAPIFPDEKTGAQETPGGSPVCTLHIAARSNHPLGMFGPGFKEVGDYFISMTKQLNANPTAHGFLGSTAWLSSGDRGYSSEVMTVMYFKTPEDVQNYAHGPLHSKAMAWWADHAKEFPHIGLMHEFFGAPKNGWEGVFLNYHPSQVAATSQEAEVNGQKVWVSPLVRAKGPLLYSKGRMGKQFGKTEWTAFEEKLKSTGDADYAEKV